MLLRLGVLTIQLLFEAMHGVRREVAYVIRVIKNRDYPQDALVDLLFLFEGHTSGHVVDRCPLRTGGHQSLAELLS